MCDTEGKEMTIDIPMEEGEPLGATPNDKMIITKVQSVTISEGKLKIGDQILLVNDTVIKDTHLFFALLRYAPPCARYGTYRNPMVLRGGGGVGGVRDEKKAEELLSRVHIPADRARNITRRDGFSYELVKMTWKAGGAKLGMGIKYFRNRVLVSKTDPASRPCVKALQSKGEVTMVLESPETTEAKHWTQQALTVQAAPPPSVQMNLDVRDIAQRELARLAAKVGKVYGKELKSILGGQKRPTAVIIDDSKPYVESRQFGHEIASDNEGKNLRAVKK